MYPSSLECRIDVEEAPTQVPGGDTDGRRVKDRSPPLFARAQRCFGLHALGDVHIDDLQKRSGSLGCRRHCGRNVQPNRAAVLFQVLLFDLTLRQRATPEFCQRLRSCRAFFLGVEFEEAVPDDLFLGAAEHSLQRGVRCGKDAVEPG